MIRLDLKDYESLGVKCKTLFDEYEVRYCGEVSVCPCCGADRLHSKGRYVRRLRHLSVYGRRSIWRVHTRRYECQICRKSFIPDLPGIVKWRHSSEGYRRYIYQQHHDGICASTLAHRELIGTATVERIYRQFTDLKARERMSLDCPRVLGIDEHTLHKKQRFATTFCDLKNHRVFDIAEGKSAEQLEPFLSRLKGRDKVRIVCIDMSSSYRSLIRKYFPNARIVADRFHVVRVVLHHFMQLFRQVAPQIKNQRGYLNALRTRPDRLTDPQKQLLQTLFKLHPPLEVLYHKRTQIWELMNQKHQTKKQCESLIQQLLQIIDELQDSQIPPLVTLANTLNEWKYQIAPMWRFTKSNGITEGFHRKMKLIQRRAYGFRNFQNYRIRVIAMCG